MSNYTHNSTKVYQDAKFEAGQKLDRAERLRRLADRAGEALRGGTTEKGAKETKSLHERKGARQTNKPQGARRMRDTHTVQEKRRVRETRTVREAKGAREAKALEEDSEEVEDEIETNAAKVSSSDVTETKGTGDSPLFLPKRNREPDVDWQSLLTPDQLEEVAEARRKKKRTPDFALAAMDAAVKAKEAVEAGGASARGASASPVKESSPSPVRPQPPRGSHILTQEEASKARPKKGTKIYIYWQEQGVGEWYEARVRSWGKEATVAYILDASKETFNVDELVSEGHIAWP